MRNSHCVSLGRDNLRDTICPRDERWPESEEANSYPGHGKEQMINENSENARETK